MRPVRNRKISGDMGLSLKKSIPALLSNADLSDKTTKNSKKAKKCRKQNNHSLRSKTSAVSKKQLDQSTKARPPRRNELSMLIDASIEHYSGRTRRGSIDMKLTRTINSVIPVIKKEPEPQTTPRELRNGRDTNYIEDETDEDIPPLSKKKRLRTNEDPLNFKTIKPAIPVINEEPKPQVTHRELQNGRDDVNYIEDETDEDFAPLSKKKRLRPIEDPSNYKTIKSVIPVVKKEPEPQVNPRELGNGRDDANYKDDETDEDFAPLSKKIRSKSMKGSFKEVRLLDFDVKKEVFSDESLDAPLPPRKKPRDLERLKQRKSLIKDVTSDCKKNGITSESGFQNEFVRSILFASALPNGLPLPEVIKVRTEKRIVKKKRKEKSEPSTIPRPVPAIALSPPPVNELLVKKSVIPYPMIGNSEVNKLLNYSFESVPQGEVWFHTFIRQDMNCEQCPKLNVNSVRAGEGFKFELPYEMAISRVIQKTKTPLKKVVHSMPFGHSRRISRKFCAYSLGKVVDTPNGDLKAPSPNGDLKDELPNGNLKDGLPDGDLEGTSPNGNLKNESVDDDLREEETNIQEDRFNVDSEPQSSDALTPIPSEQYEGMFKKQKFCRKFKPCLDDFARKSPRCHASTLAILSELRNKQLSDAEDSQSDCSESKLEFLKKPTKSMSPAEIEVLIQKPLEDLSLILRDVVPSEALEPTFSCEFDEVFDWRQLNALQFDESQLPIFKSFEIKKATDKLHSVVEKPVTTIDKTIVPRKRGRPRKNQTGWPTKKKPPSRLSLLSSVSNDSHNLATPIPSESLDCSVELPGCMINHTGLTNGFNHGDGNSVEQENLKLTRLSSVKKP
ncbi:uncharacterized protein LOC136036716 [Artemia franciscana]|uniref:Uncharacterized protein n=1 Tax=Artemia franciscana TaxID=6661 RepID=A0AA88I5C4_ARTSF|nr:hypothetical protein QYM36_004163 [Artemia franciscana]